LGHQVINGDGNPAAGKVASLFDFLSLLTRVKFGRRDIDVATLARRQYLFPVAGFIIGAIVSIVAFFLFDLVGNQVDEWLKALGTVLFLYFLTGLIHIEGLADFGDGLMASGTSERKRQAMKDVSLGAAGVFFLIAAFLSLFLLVSKLGGWADSPALMFWADSLPLVWGLILAEISAKLAMITVMTMGPSSHQGMGSAFVLAASPDKLVVGSIIAVLIAFLISGVFCVLVLLGIVAGAIVAFIAKRHFGGVGGDSFGAANEFGRMLTLLAWVVLL